MTLRVPNAIDLHCHFGPDTLGGGAKDPLRDKVSITALEAAREAADHGQAALVLKAHSFASPVVARTIEQAVPDVRVFGGMCTDYLSGGLNVDAVDAALSLGAKIVWLPTMHSRSDFERARDRTIHDEPIAVVDDDGRVVEAVRDIFDRVLEHDAILATGHTTAEEHHAVVEEFAGRGQVIVTHACEPLAGPRLTPRQCSELADLGAMIEITALLCTPVAGRQDGIPVAEVIDMIGAVGTSRVCLSTDYGWSTTLVPRPAAGLRAFLESLWDEGMSERDLELMASSNPARLLGIAV
jgi:hypothetical protein